ncbi:FAD-dependent monooxygenase [Falsiruegeria litorea]|uniref:FAD-dependent monooxygenase n=1 Tax=Falsiruegeria litorea TaxID=1280831 RepID=UPI001BFD3412|nr:FAD-dependent monooxygenase [Falsiruegeria litorea]MBT8170585.1 FAD-dependent monooxygenase [Falsiruegeria litorea]
MELQDHKIIVVGAGIGGLTAALVLRARGADVTVFEQAEAITEVGAGLQISPNGRVVLRALGLEPAFDQVSVQAQSVVLRDYRRTAEVLRLDLAKYAAEQVFSFVHRADLIDVLASAVRAAGVHVRLLQKVERVENGPKPVLHLANGAQVQADLIVGADGLHSPTRAALNRADAPFFTGQVAWRTIVPNTVNLPNEANVFMGPGRHLVCYPLRGGSVVNIVAVQEKAEWAAEGWHHVDDPENLRRAFAGFQGVARALLDQVEDVRQWGLFRHPVADVWQQGRLAILGDAAHPTLPFMAQGANMAFEDAWVLADALATQPDIEMGLAQYQARRHQRASRVIEAANGNAWKYHLSFPPVRGLAHLALRLGGAVAPERMVRQFDWLYGYDVTAGSG